MAERAFRHVTPEEFRWHTELSGDPDSLCELLWIDGHLDDGWQIGIGLMRARPLMDGHPAIFIRLLSPDGRCIQADEKFTHEEFQNGGGLSARWGRNNSIVADVGPSGSPGAYRLSLRVREFEVDLHCVAECTGVKFVTASPGYTACDTKSGLATGWWPLIPRARVSGSIVVQGEARQVSGLFYLERQVSSLPLGGREGEKTAQSIWAWGNFHAGDFTAGWTDSGASEDFGYRHFTPFVMWKGSDPFLSTFSFASYVEKFAINPKNGLAYPEVVTLKASGGDIDFFARLVSGHIIDHYEMNNKRDSLYCRQASEVHAQIRQWGATRRIEGRAVHEWGTRAGNFPFIRNEPR